MYLDVLIIVFLIILNGFFSMSELAVVSARRARLSVMAEAGSKGARVALELADDSSRFLSSVQIGITLIGILSGAYSGTTIAQPLGEYLSAIPLIAEHGEELAIALVVIVVTYLSLIIGELVPKQLALKNAEAIACVVSRPLRMLATMATPLIYLLDRSNKLVLGLMGEAAAAENKVSEEEVKAVIAEGTESGVFDQQERQMMERVMRLHDIRVTSIMTHRQDVVWIDMNEAAESIIAKMQESRHSRYPLCEGDVEKVVGVVIAKDLLFHIDKPDSINLRAAAQQPITVPDKSSILEALEKFKQSTSNMAVVIDEYGGLEGIITLKDIMEAIVGVLPEPKHREDYTGIQRDDGSWLLDGGLAIHEAEELLGVRNLAEGSGQFSTVAGFLLAQFGHIPKESDKVHWRNLCFEIMDMDRNRIDKVLVSES
jgi:putative hemolysin